MKHTMIDRNLLSGALVPTLCLALTLTGTLSACGVRAQNDPNKRTLVHALLHSNAERHGMPGMPRPRGLVTVGLTSLAGVSDQELLRHLLSFSRACSYTNIYHSLGVEMDSAPTDAELRDIPRAELKERLEKLRKSHANPTTWQNVAVTYTLTHFGLDYAANLKLLLQTFTNELALASGALKQPAPVKKWAALQQKAGLSLFEAMALPDLLLRLYENNGDAGVLRQVLAMRGIGGLRVGATEAQTTLLLNRTRNVVDCLANSPPAVLSLSRFVSPMMIRKDYFKVCKLLGELAEDTAYPRRAAAAAFLKAIQTARGAGVQPISRKT